MMKNISRIIGELLVAVALAVTIAASSALAGSSDGWHLDKLCGQRLPALQFVSIQGCEKAYCADALDTRICARQKSEETDEIQITLEYQSAIKKQWTTKVVPIVFGPDSLHLDRADLDGDGKDEILFAAMQAQSNGMGVEFWTVWAIDEGQVSHPLEIEDYGTMGFPTRPNGSEGCHILVSRWMEGWEPVRGPGLYIVGRWYEYMNGEFSPQFDRPAIYRRYLFSLERLRGKSLSKKPILWYRSSKAFSVVGPYPF